MIRLILFLFASIANAQSPLVVTPYGGSGGAGGSGGCAQPNAPGSAAFTNVTATSLQANWTANGNPGGTNYSAVLSTDVFPNNDPGNQTVNTTNVFAAYSGLTPGGTYYAEVDATNGCGTSAFTTLGSTVTLPLSGNPLASQFIPPLTPSAPAWIWTHDISTKPFQNSTAQGSLQTLKMSGLRNEEIYYQFFLSAPSLLQNVYVSMTTPTDSHFGGTISTQTATSAGNCRIYLSSGVAIDTMSATGGNGDYFGVSHALIPDPVIPFRDPYYNQLTNVNPRTIPSGFTQGYVIECFIPTGIASAYYAFNVLIATGASPGVVTNIATLPGAIEVFDSTMTVTPAMGMVNSTGYAAGCIQAYGGPTSSLCAPYRPDLCGTNGDCDAQVMAHDFSVYYLDHKMSISGSNGSGQSAAGFDTVFGHLVDGTVSGTYINTIIPGAKLTDLQAMFYGSSLATANQWMTQFGARTKVFNYACDEPGTPPGGQWPTCQTNMNNTVASGIGELITATFANFLVEGDTTTVTYMSPLGENLHGHGSDYTVWLAASVNNFLGSYWDCISSNGYCIGGFTGIGTGHPNPHIDGRPVNNAAIPISIAFSSGTFVLNSTIDQCWTDTTVGNSSGGCGSQSSAVQFGMQNFGEGGAGAMLYAGQGDETWGYLGTSNWLGVSVSTPIYVGSLRDLLFSYGIQYLDYRTILKANGKDSVFWTQLATWMTNDENFNQNADSNGSFSGTITSARANMGCAIHQIKWGGGATCGW